MVHRVGNEGQLNARNGTPHILQQEQTVLLKMYKSLVGSHLGYCKCDHTNSGHILRRDIKRQNSKRLMSVESELDYNGGLSLLGLTTL